MSESAEKLKSALLELPLEERLEIAGLLYASLPPPAGVISEGDPGFDEILQRRIEELKTGKVAGVPAEEVMERLHKKYAK